MIFSRPEFIFAFLPVVFTVSWLIPRFLLIPWLTLASLFFYGWSGEPSWSVWRYGLPFLFFAGFTYLVGSWMARCSQTSHRRLLAAIGIVFVLAWWGLVRSRFPIGSDVFIETVIAVGVGFYVLRAIGYYVDIYYRRLPPASDFLTYFLYLGFFVHLPSGPITPWKWFSEGLKQRLGSGVRPDGTGFYLFSIGLLKKAIADTTGAHIDPFIAASDWGAATAWTALLGYSLQIYFDFAGYTDMALGVGRLMGIPLPPNFDRPYRKRNLIEFWNAWHITLSHWLRDYLFSPLGRFLFSFAPLNRSPLIIATLCYIATFAVCGLWHGWEGPFLVWGFYHGVGLSGCKLYGEIARKHFPRSYHVFMFQTIAGKVLATGSTFLFVCLGWVFFRSSTLAEATEWFKGLTGYYGLATSAVAPDTLVWLGSAGVAVTLATRFEWHPEKLAYWQKIALTAIFMVTLFYYFVSENVGMTPFIYNVF